MRSSQRGTGAFGSVNRSEKKLRETVWTTAIYAIISSGPAFLVGCTLGFPSAAFPDLDFNAEKSDLFGVSVSIWLVSSVNSVIAKHGDVTCSKLFIAL